MHYVSSFPNQCINCKLLISPSQQTIATGWVYPSIEELPNNRATLVVHTGENRGPNLLYLYQQQVVSRSFCCLMAQQLAVVHNLYSSRTQQNSLFDSLITRFTGCKSTAYCIFKLQSIEPLLYIFPARIVIVRYCSNISWYLKMLAIVIFWLGSLLLCLTPEGAPANLINVGLCLHRGVNTKVENWLFELISDWNGIMSREVTLTRVILLNDLFSDWPEQHFWFVLLLLSCFGPSQLIVKPLHARALQCMGMKWALMILK